MYSFYNADYILIIKFLSSVPRQEISESSFVDLDFFIHLKNYCMFASVSLEARGRCRINCRVRDGSDPSPVLYSRFSNVCLTERNILIKTFLL